MNKFDDIVERYFKGETTIQEENELKLYVLSSEVAEQHRYLVPMFGFYQSEEERKMPEKKVVKFDLKHNHYFKWVAYTGIAASVLLAVTLFNYNDRKDYAVVYGQKINDEEYAQKLAVEKMTKVNHILERNLAPIQNIEKVRSVIQDRKANLERTREIINSVK